MIGRLDRITGIEEAFPLKGCWIRAPFYGIRGGFPFAWSLFFLPWSFHSDLFIFRLPIVIRVVAHELTFAVPLDKVYELQIGSLIRVLLKNLLLRFVKFGTNVLCEVRDTVGNKTRRELKGNKYSNFLTDAKINTRFQSYDTYKTCTLRWNAMKQRYNVKTQCCVAFGAIPFKFKLIGCYFKHPSMYDVETSRNKYCKFLEIHTRHRVTKL